MLCEQQGIDKEKKDRVESSSVSKEA